MTNKSDKDAFGALNDALEHGADWFRIGEPFKAKCNAVNEGRELDLVRSRGAALDPAFVDMALRWDGDESTRDLISENGNAKVSHGSGEIVLLRAE